MVSVAVVGVTVRGVLTVGANVVSVRLAVVGVTVLGARTVGAKPFRASVAVVGVTVMGEPPALDGRNSCLRLNMYRGLATI